MGHSAYLISSSRQYFNSCVRNQSQRSICIVALREEESRRETISASLILHLLFRLSPFNGTTELSVFLSIGQ